MTPSPIGREPKGNGLPPFSRANGVLEAAAGIAQLEIDYGLSRDHVRHFS